MRQRRSERYVLLGQFLDENAARISDALHDAAVRHYTTRASAVTQTLFMGEWGVRIFVEQAQHDHAHAIVAAVVDP